MRAATLALATVIVFSTSVVGAERTDAVCTFVQADGGPMSMGYGEYLYEFLPPSFVNSLGKGMSADDIARLNDWYAKIQVRVLLPPAHGSMSINPTLDPGKPSYAPAKGFRGQDRVDVRIQGVDFEGRNISKKVVFYVNVLKPREFDHVTTRQGHRAAIAKYCGSQKPVWRLQESAEGVK